MKAKYVIICFLIVSVCSLLSVVAFGVGASVHQKDVEAQSWDTTKTYKCELEYYYCWEAKNYEAEVEVYCQKNKKYSTLTVKDVNNWLEQGDKSKEKDVIKSGADNCKGLFEMYEYGWRVKGFIIQGDHTVGGLAMKDGEFYETVNFEPINILGIGTIDFIIVFDDGLGFQYKATKGYPRHKGTGSSVGKSANIDSTKKWKQLAKNCAIQSFDNEEYFEYKGYEFNLTKDLDFKNEEIRPIGIGDRGNTLASNMGQLYAFKGKLNGNNHTISNAKIVDQKGYTYDQPDSQTMKYMSGLGLFGCVESLQIENLKLKNISVSGMTHNTENQNFKTNYYLHRKPMGVLVGYSMESSSSTSIKNVALEGCSIAFKYKGEAGSLSIYSGCKFGGLVGESDSKLVLENCYVDVDISVDTRGAGSFNGGGVVGYSTNETKLTNVIALIKINLKSATEYNNFGGLICVAGEGEKLSLKSCVVVIMKEGIISTKEGGGTRGDTNSIGSAYYGICSPIWVSKKQDQNAKKNVTCTSCYYDDKSSITWTDSLGGTSKTIIETKQ